MAIELTIKERVATIVLARPERRNSFDTQMLQRMEDVLASLVREPAVEVVVLRAEGSAFCGGTDLKELELLDAKATLHWQRRTSAMVERWARLDATTVTAFQGAAVGSGAIIGLASDLRIATTDAWFQFPEVGHGVPLTWSGIQLLVRLVGADMAKRLLLLQERLAADELERLRLVLKVVQPNQLDSEVEGIVQTLLKSPALARSMCKHAISTAASAPGFATNELDPFLASLSIYAHDDQAFSWNKK